MKFSCTESNFFIAGLFTIEQVTLLMMATDYTAHSAILSLAIQNILCDLKTGKTKDSVLQRCFHRLGFGNNTSACNCNSLSYVYMCVCVYSPSGMEHSLYSDSNWCNRKCKFEC